MGVEGVSGKFILAKISRGSDSKKLREPDPRPGFHLFGFPSQ